MWGRPVEFVQLIITSETYKFVKRCERKRLNTATESFWHFQCVRLSCFLKNLWKCENESLSESFGSHWANNVKINAYCKKMKVFFDLACMSTCCWGLPKPKYEPFITHTGLAKSLARRPGAIVFSSRATKMHHCPARRATSPRVLKNS